MKSTAERLAESYCRPTTGLECNVLGFGTSAIGYAVIRDGECNMLTHTHELGNRTEIPVQHLSDLVHDRIVPWRLEEDGFTESWPNTVYDYYIADARLCFNVNGGFNLYMTDLNDTVSLVLPLKGIRTYTDLLNLIRLIG